MRRIEVLNDRAATVGIKSADIEDGSLVGMHDEYDVYSAIGWDNKPEYIFYYTPEGTEEQIWKAVEKIASTACKGSYLI